MSNLKNMTNLVPGTSKDTVYIDVDDEITTIIDKVRSSGQKIVAVVLPKRATVFQSIVNLKLLKRSADDAKKQLVLISSEAGLLPLAGTVGLYVAKNLQSKPEIPPVPGAIDDDEIMEDPSGFSDGSDAEYTAQNAGSRPIGELATRAGGVIATEGGIETIALDDDEEDVVPVAGAAVAAKTLKKNKKLKVPNFNRFRALIALGVVALILLVVGFYLAIAVLPKAVITIKTDASDINNNLTLTLDTAAKTLDKTTLVVPAQTAQNQKTQSQQAAATGAKNNGARATGSIKMTVQKCTAGPPPNVSVGSGVSAGGKTYITQSDASFSLTGVAPGCGGIYTSGSVQIIAQVAGTSYNTASSVPFVVASRSDVTGTGSASGGTDDIVKVVQQADIDGAKQKLAAFDASAIKTQLATELKQDGVYALPDTFDAGQPNITTTSAVGDQADNVTVTATYTYTMYGTSKANLDSLLSDSIKAQVDTGKETILTNGLDKAQVRVLESSATTKKISLQTVGTVGPDLHIADLKKQAAGKKSGDIVPVINSLPGVTDTNVKLSPFWVSSIPKNTSKITVVVEKVPVHK
jgi:hypothetical protein